MQSLPDFREKQILYVEGSRDVEQRLQIKNGNVALYKDGRVDNQLSCARIFSVFVVGEMSLSSVLIRKCQENGISLAFLRDNLLPYAVIGADAEGNTLLRSRQYAMTEETALKIAKILVENKTRNQIALLRSIGVDFIGKTPLVEYVGTLKDKIDNVRDFRELLGLEGSVSKTFFGLYFKDVGWRRRMPRAKTDEINVLLDMGYTFLFNYVDSLLRLYGFDVYKGVYHRLFFQRKSLVCDIEEPLRCIMERAVRKIFTLGRFDPKDFRISQGKYFLDIQKNRKYASIFLGEIMSHKEGIFEYVRSYYYAMLDDTDEFPDYSVR